MYWDETGESWVGMNVSRQPAGILFSATGDELVRWNGEPDLGEVLAVIGDAS